jgi:hypothetical protein
MIVRLSISEYFRQQFDWTALQSMESGRHLQILYTTKDV